ncbi:two-component system chemotaxis response regulator CheY [Actimicrobium sp. GrIS 1.19]|uniref:response regulator n=1 Tax=Actimicrobium sp. GrIS 1.19 TaxID=3071708 RepID=UPI002E058B21|nr:two-component system chemotaxis response regulator CheY [Actimicrobium sp. GrIS 1.19]
MLKVVIIDSNAISRNLLGSVLTGGGHEVVGDASSSNAGLAHAVKLRPQVICVDIGTAKDNLDILDLLREALPKTLLFLVSASFDPDTVQAAMQRGVLGFIVKPFNSVTVLKVIRTGILKVAQQAGRVNQA